MAIDPALISAGIGFLGSVFGGRPKMPDQLKRQLDMENRIRQMGIDLYNNTDLEATDRQAIDAYSRGTMDRAMQMASNYDARAAGAGGSAMYKSDTQKGRARNQIFGDSASRIANLEADLISSRPGRKASLLPQVNPQGAMQAAGMLDQFSIGQDQAQRQGLMDLATLAAPYVSQMFGKKSKSSGSTIASTPSSMKNDRTIQASMNMRPASVPSQGTPTQLPQTMGPINTRIQTGKQMYNPTIRRVGQK